MPFPRWLARVNSRFTNRLLGHLALRAPGMGVIVHVGRKTQRRYRTPVVVFPRNNRLIIALTYGRNAEWVQNVLARNGCDLETTNCKLRLFEPRVFHDEQRQEMPVFVRLFLGLLHVSDFIEFIVAKEERSQAQSQ